MPATLLAGGHANGDGGGPPNAVIDRERAVFYKRLPGGPRGEREAAFYAAVFPPQPGGEQGAVVGAAGGPWDDASALSRCVPRCLGAPAALPVGAGGGASLYLPLLDVTAAYVRPCVADIKVGQDAPRWPIMQFFLPTYAL